MTVYAETRIISAPSQYIDLRCLEEAEFMVAFLRQLELARGGLLCLHSKQLKLIPPGPQN